VFDRLLVYRVRGVAGLGGVIQAFRFALDPTPGQDAGLRSHCGAQRYAFNWGLALVTAVLDQRKAEASYGIPDTELTPSVPWSAYSLRKLWNQAKGQVAPWWARTRRKPTRLVWRIWRRR
jgi:putative transposase